MLNEHLLLAQMNECRSTKPAGLGTCLAAFMPSNREGTGNSENVQLEKIIFWSAGLEFKHQNHPRTKASRKEGATVTIQ